MNGFTFRITCSIALAAVTCAAGCGSQEKQNEDFHTSGSREADQRAEQRVAKVQQLRGDAAKRRRSRKLFTNGSA
jgi:hypothetical protein